jgi:hypothetical protein
MLEDPQGLRHALAEPSVRDLGKGLRMGVLDERVQLLPGFAARRPRGADPR